MRMGWSPIGSGAVCLLLVSIPLFAGCQGVCQYCEEGNPAKACQQGLVCVNHMCVRPEGNLAGECCDTGPAECAEAYYCVYQTCEASPIYPPPKHNDTFQDHFQIDSETEIVLPPDPAPSDQTAGQILAEQISASYGIEPPIRSCTEEDPVPNTIVLGTPASNPAVQTLLEQLSVTIPDQGPVPEEDYAIRVSPDGWVLVAGRGERGVLYGSQALKQMVRGWAQKDPTGALKEVLIRDYPDTEQRQFLLLMTHYYIPLDEDGDGERDPYKFTDVGFRLDVARDYLHVLSEFRYNMVLFKMADVVAWEHMPQPQDTAISISEYLDLVREANRYGLEVVPLLNGSSGHYGWIGTSEEPVEYTEAYSIAHNEEHLAIYKDLIGEILDATETVQPVRYFHAGMDEDWNFGPRCGDYYRQWVNETYDLLTGRGVKMMIWYDNWISTPDYTNNYLAYPDMDVVVWDYSEPIPPSTFLKIHDVTDKGMEVTWALSGNGLHNDFVHWLNIGSELQKGFLAIRWTKRGTICKGPPSDLFPTTVNGNIRKHAQQFWNTATY